MTEPLAGLYLHVPFCDRVCPYCDFAVRTGDRARKRRFVEGLVAEIGLWADFGTPFDTIYLGGGTPSALDPDDVGRILTAARERLVVAPDAGVFMEVNPEHVTRESAAAWAALGVRTLSLGVQSFDADALRFLGRAHDPARARRAVELAHEAGFETVALDLIYGLPGQDEAAWRRDLDAALGLRPHHLSCYQLTIHERTRFGLLERRGSLRQLPDEAQARLFRLTHTELAARGLPAYEVSNFAAAPGHRSRHNVKYWEHAPYLGLGPSAHSYRERHRWWNVRRTDPWHERLERGERPIEDEERLDAPALALEALMLGLRRAEGVDLRLVRERFGVDVAGPNAALIERLRDQGLLTVAGERIVATLDGLAVVESLAARFDVERVA